MTNKKISTLSTATVPLTGVEILPIVQSGITVSTTISEIQISPVSTGTAKSIPYLNATKVPTTGVELSFDGANLGLGEPVPAEKLHIRGVSYRTAIQMNAQTEPTGYGVRLINDTSGGQTYLSLNFNNAYSGYVEQYRFKASGDLVLNTGNLVQGTAAKGINFTANTPAAGMTSRLLNWYEEGIWTAALIGDVIAGSSPSANTAYYTRFGRQVTVTATWFNTTVSGAAGNFKITGLPFTSKAVAFCYSVGTFGGAAAYYTQMLDNSTSLITNAPVVNLAGQYIVITHTYLI